MALPLQQALTANIDANSTDSPAPATIEFGANATGGLAPYAYNLNFGDGSNSSNNTSGALNVLHTFDKAGNYTVTLAAKDSGIPSQNASANIVVTIGPTVNETATVAEALTANIDANTTNSPAPATIEFGGNGTGGSAPYSYSWNFGDGNNSTYVGPKITHTFDKAGNYTVTLAAKDSGIPSQNASANIVVTIGPTVNETATVAEALTANIDANTTNSPAPATIEFGGNGTGGSAPYSYSWNFGDGNNSTYVGPKITHTFDKAGNYTVTLAAKDSGIPSQNASANIVVTIGPTVNETVLEALINANSTNSLDANSTNSLDANSTNSLDANSTNSLDANSTNSLDANSTNSLDANSTNSLDANSTNSLDANSTNSLRCKLA